MSSAEVVGDIVLDCFAGSGTTLAVAERLGRRWIGIDNSQEAITTTLRRFEAGLEPMGDFVSRRKTCNDDPLSLFPLAQPNNIQHSDHYRKIANFTLYAEEKYRVVATETAKRFDLFTMNSSRRQREST